MGRQIESTVRALALSHGVPAAFARYLIGPDFPEDVLVNAEGFY